MKKWAIKGLVTLAAVVALCMFFSGTIKTISTAKVKLVTARQGRLEEEVKLSGQLTFPQTEEIKLAGLEGDQSVTITRVRVAKGRHVKEGDVLFEAEVSGYESAMQTLRDEYNAAQKELLDLERKNGELRLKRTEEIWIEAYDALTAAKGALMDAQTRLEVAAKLAGVTLEDGELPADTQDENLLALAEAVQKAGEEEEAAQSAFTSANRLGISEDVVTYVTTSREQTRKLEETQEKIAALTVLYETAREVTAPHDGYIVEIHVKAGDSYDGKAAAVTMSAEDTDPVLRADTSSMERRIEEGTQITIERSNGRALSKKVTGTGVDEEGKNYVDVALSDKDITNLGGGAALLNEAVEMAASYRAGSSTTLLPTSAVRGSGDSRYVYVVNEESNALGERVLKVTKRDVKVLAEVGSTVSIEDDLSRQRVAYMEDRAISDGSEVMVYAE
ncbi:MAG TPA: hypothetical protein IAC49_09085 [Candidatus Ventricola intestinavium]|nr:hypothetical protein [Candidatus Ventricola intestinavium]